MAFEGDGLSLLFRITAKDLASAEIRKLKTEVAGLSKESGVGGLAGSLGVSSQSLAALTKTALGTTTAITGLIAGAYTLAKATAEWGDSIFKAESKTRLSAEALSVVKFATKEANTNFDELVRGIGRLEINISRGITNPSGKAAKALRDLGIDAEKAATDPQTAFLEITRKLEAMEDVTKRDRIANDLFGRSFLNLIPALELLGSGFEDTKARAKELNQIMGEDAVKDAHNFAVEARDLDAMIAGLSRSIGTALMPSLKELIDVLKDTGKEGKDSFDAIDFSLGNVIRGVAALIDGIRQLNTIGKYVNPLQPILDSVQTFKDTLGNVDQSAIPSQAIPKLGVPLRTTEGITKEDKERAKEEEKLEREVEQKRKAASDARLSLLSTQLEKEHRLYQTALDKLKEARDADQISEDQYVQGVVAAEDYLLRRTKANIAAQIDEADAQEKDTNLRSARIAKLRDDEAAAQAEHDKNIREAKIEANKQKLKDDEEYLQESLDINRKHRDTMLQLLDDFGQREIALNQSLVETNNQTEETAAKRQEEIEQASFKRRIDALLEEQKTLLQSSKEWADLQDQILRLISERDANEEESQRRIAAARQKDLDNQKRYFDNLLRQEREYQRRQRDFERERIDNASRVRGFEIPESIEERAKLDRRDAEAETRYRISILNADERADIEDAKRAKASNEEIKGIEANYQAAREQAWIEYYERVRQINEQADQDQRQLKLNSTFGGGFFESIGLNPNLANNAANQAKIISDAWVKAGGLVGGAVRGMAQGFGSLIEQWTLTGNIGPNAIRKMTAAVLAGLAAQATVEALMNLARGFAALANPFTAWQAPLYFKAAAIFGLVAVTSAVAGRAIAGNAFTQGQGAAGSQATGGQSGGSSGTTTPPPVTRVEDRQPVVQIIEHRHTLQLPNGFVVAELEAAHQNNNSRLDRTMRSLVPRYT